MFTSVVHFVVVLKQKCSHLKIMHHRRGNHQLSDAGAKIPEATSDG